MQSDLYALAVIFSRTEFCHLYVVMSSQLAMLSVLDMANIAGSVISSGAPTKFLLSCLCGIAMAAVIQRLLVCLWC